MPEERKDKVVKVLTKAIESVKDGNIDKAKEYCDEATTMLLVEATVRDLDNICARYITRFPF